MGSDQHMGERIPSDELPQHLVMVEAYQIGTYPLMVAEYACFVQATHRAAPSEWEKAARGTDGRIYPWGNQWDPARANTSEGGPGETTPVGRYPSGVSLYGAYDMAGNVGEWTSTTFKPYPYQANDGSNDLSNPARKEARGGSWSHPPQFVRAAYRCYAIRSLEDSDFGGRLVRGGGGLAYRCLHF